MAEAKRDGNSVPTLLGVSSVDGITPVLAAVNPATGRLLVDLAGGGSGTVTSVSVVTANGFAGTVATATTTPAITISTSINAPVLAGNGTAIAAATTTGSGSTVVLNTSPALVTPILGTPTSGTLTNCTGLPLTTGVTGILGATNGGTGVANNAASTLTISGSFATTLTISGITSLTLPTSGTVTAQGNTVTGSGSIVLATSPTLVTPILGVAAVTTINKVTLTAPATGSTLTIADGKTLTVSNSLTLAGTDATTMTFPTTSATMARTDAAQTFAGTQTFTNAVINTNDAITASGNAATIPVTARVHTVTNNSAATLTITFTTASAVDGQLHLVRIYDSSAVAQTLTLVNTENSTVTPPASTNGSTTLPVTLGLQFNAQTTKWRIIAVA